MAFKLPNWADLSEEQILTLDLDINENYVVKGSPGTGKSVIAEVHH